jgi:hypothetical protein
VPDHVSRPETLGFSPGSGSFDPTLIAFILIVSAIYFSLSMIVTLNVKLHWALRYLFGFTVLPLFFFLVFKTVSFWDTILAHTLPSLQKSARGNSLIECLLYFPFAVLGIFIYFSILKYFNKYLPQATHPQPSLISYGGTSSSEAEIFIFRKGFGSRYPYDLTINDNKICQINNGQNVHLNIPEGKYTLGVTSRGGWSGFSTKNESSDVIFEGEKIYYFMARPIFPYAKIESTTKDIANKLLSKAKNIALEETILRSIQPLKDV